MADLVVASKLRSFFSDHEPGDYDELKRYVDGIGEDTNAIEVLANACKQSGWRRPLREAGFLQLALNMLNSDSSPTLSVQLLRLIGNNCYDEDPSRDMTTPYLAKIAKLLAYPQLRPYADGVLHNVFQDPKWSLLEAATDQHVHEIIVGIVSLEDAPQHWTWSSLLVLTHICDHIDSTQRYEVLTPQFLVELISLPSKFKEPGGLFGELGSQLLHAIIRMLDNDTMRVFTANAGLIPNLVLLYKDWTFWLKSAGQSYPDAEHMGDDLDDTELPSGKYQNLLGEHLSFLTCDVAAVWELKDVEHIREDTAFRTLVDYLGIKDNTVLPYITCLVFGNLAKTDSMASAMVQDFKIDTAAVSQIRHHAALLTGDSAADRDSQKLMHAAGSLLRNLAVPEANADSLLKSEAMAAATILCKPYADRQVVAEPASPRHNSRDLPAEMFLAGLRILRQLASHSPAACQALIEGQPLHDRSPATSSSFDAMQRASNPAISIDNFATWLARTGPPALAPQARTELTRTLTALYRTLSRPGAAVAGPTSALIQATAARPIFAEALAAMAQSAAGTPLAAEAWLGLALTARSGRVGAVNVYQALDGGLSGAVERLAGPAETLQAERANARVLAFELLRQLEREEVLSAEHAAVLRDLVKREDQLTSAAASVPD